MSLCHQIIQKTCQKALLVCDFLYHSSMSMWLSVLKHYEYVTFSIEALLVCNFLFHSSTSMWLSLLKHYEYVTFSIEALLVCDFLYHSSTSTWLSLLKHYEYVTFYITAVRLRNDDVTKLIVGSFKCQQLCQRCNRWTSWHHLTMNVANCNEIIEILMINNVN